MDAPLDTARLRMRPFVPEDAERMFPMFALDEVGRYTGGTHASIDDTRALIAKATEHQEAHGFALWVVEERETGELVGEVGLQLLEHRGPEVEIGWSFHPSRWGRGYAHEAASAWLDVAFGALELDEVLATIIPENAPSRRLAERLGMTLTGERYVHRATHYVYALDRAAWAASER